MEEKNENLTYLGIFQIGPVQDFIKYSRKTRDLWASSYLLSYLVMKAIDAIGKDNLIYPSPKLYDHLTDLINHKFLSVIPNRFVVISNDKDELEKNLKKAEKTIKDELKVNGRKIIDEFKKLSNNGNKLFDVNIDTLFQRQFDNFLELYWIISPVNNNYSESYKKAEILFNGRKSVRDFNYVEENGFKCTLCGEREPITNDSTNRIKIKEEWKKISQSSKFKYKFKENEHLCTICSLKRLFKEEDVKFPSTSVIASSSFMNKLINNLCKNIDLEKILENFYNKIISIQDLFNILLNEQIYGEPLDLINESSKNLKDNLKDLFSFEGLVFYKETYDNLIKKLESKSNNVMFNEENKKILGEIKKELDILYNYCGKPSKYFAVIQYDGDNIGERITSQNSIEEHRNFSEKISRFTQFVVNLQNNYLCKVVYAGGDEGLIFSSLSDAFNIIKELDEEFKNKGDNLTLTFSLTIAHYTHPLSEVIEKSRIMLKKAKESGGLFKNCIGINLLKRSGEDILLLSSMNLINYKLLISYFNEIINFYNNKIISKRWWRSLINEKNAFVDINSRNEIVLDKDLLINECKRLIRRKSKNYNCFEKIIEEYINNQPIKNGIEFFIDSMAICEFIAREE